MLLVLAASLLAADAPTVSWRPGDRPPTAVARGLDRATLDAIRDRPDLGRDALRVAVQGDEADRPAMLGRYSVEGEALIFTPRYPLAAEVTYVATCKVGGASSRITPSRPAPGPAVEVSRVDPEADELPANLLKFYIRFSGPMGRGAAYEHIRLRNADGTAVEAPFLELGEELWDPSGTRFTLLLDPGRIKRGLVPRVEDGPILEAGKSYILEIGRAWPDAEGSPLRSAYRKAFRAAKEIEAAVDPRAWRLSAPRLGTTEPLDVDLRGPLDRALLERLVGVEDGAGVPVKGTVEVADRASRWRFKPDAVWSAAEFRLVVGSELEDLAGNAVGRPFELDAFDKVEARGLEPVRLPFRPRK